MATRLQRRHDMHKNTVVVAGGIGLVHIQWCTRTILHFSGTSEGAPDDRRLPEGLRGLIKLEEA